MQKQIRFLVPGSVLVNGQAPAPGNNDRRNIAGYCRVPDEPKPGFANGRKATFALALNYGPYAIPVILGMKKAKQPTFGDLALAIETAHNATSIRLVDVTILVDPLNGEAADDMLVAGAQIAE